MPQISEKGMAMPSSPIRKLVPFADKAKERGIKVYHLNIGQPDIQLWLKQSLCCCPEGICGMPLCWHPELCESHDGGCQAFQKPLRRFHGIHLE